MPYSSDENSLETNYKGGSKRSGHGGQFPLSRDQTWSRSPNVAPARHNTGSKFAPGYGGEGIAHEECPPYVPPPRIYYSPADPGWQPTVPDPAEEAQLVRDYLAHLRDQAAKNAQSLAGFFEENQRPIREALLKEQQNKKFVGFASA